MNFDWQSWIERFIEVPGYNNTEAEISKAVRPVYGIIGVRRLSPTEDCTEQYIYIDVLNRHNQRQMNAEVEYNSGSSNPVPIPIGRAADKITRFPFPINRESINIWHPGGEGIIGLKAGYSYLIVFREIVEEEKPIADTNLGGIQVIVNQVWIASLKPDRLGNVSFFVDIR